MLLVGTGCAKGHAFSLFLSGCPEWLHVILASLPPPPLHVLQRGFFASCLRTVSSKDLPALEEICRAMIEEKLPFERLEVSRKDLIKLFKVRNLKPVFPLAWHQLELLACKTHYPQLESPPPPGDACL